MGMDNQEAADASQFEAGYSAEPTETPAPVAKPEEKAPVKAEEKPAPVDPLKEVIDRLDRFEKGHTTLAGQFGGLQRAHKEIQDRLAAAQAATKTVDDAPTNAQVKEAMTDPEEWATLKDAYPEWAKATEKFMDAKLATLKAPQALDPAEIEKIVGERVAGQAAAVRKELMDSHLDSIVDGDWLAEINTPQFAAWRQAQPAAINELGASDKVSDAARMLKLYAASKLAKPEPNPEPKKDVSARQKRIEAAVNPRGSGGHATGGTELDDFESGYSG